MVMLSFGSVVGGFAPRSTRIDRGPDKIAFVGHPHAKQPHSRPQVSDHESMPTPKTLIALVLSFNALVVSSFHGEPLSAEQLSLEFVERIKIKNEDEGLTEPSGLALSRKRNALWTVSDNTKKVFKLGLDGELKSDNSFRIDSKNLEGIALSGDGKHLYVVHEKRNKILKIDVEDQEEIDSYPISEMTRFRDEYFPAEPKNKGLEGIALTDDGDLWVIKEAEPGLLLKVSKSLDTIQSVHPLGADSGFTDDDTQPKDIDFSGLCFYQQPDQMWIVSHQAKRLYLYDIGAGKVTDDFALTYTDDGETREIKQAEGVAFDAETKRIYIVSDRDARLFVYQLSGGSSR